LVRSVSTLYCHIQILPVRIPSRSTHSLTHPAEKLAFLLRHKYGPRVLERISAISLLELSEPRQRGRGTDYRIVLLAMNMCGGFDTVVEYRCSRPSALPYGFMDTVDGMVAVVLRAGSGRVGSPARRGVSGFKREYYE
jgi:hypothetical protein